MASTYKTEHYGLNNWLGSDKPKREDFNQDNSRVDSALNQIQTQMDMHTVSTVHVSGQERTAWNGKARIVTGAYMGDGKASRVIALGFAPQFVAVWPAAYPPVTFDSLAGVTTAMSAFGTAGSESLGLALSETGFTVQNSSGTSPMGLEVMLNMAQVPYGYAAFV